MNEHTEPKLIWTRFAGLSSMLYAFIYSWFSDTPDEKVLWFCGFVVACWMLGGNGRAALIDAIRSWKGGK